MLKAEMTSKMIEFYGGAVNDVTHFLKVHSYARTIAVLEKVDAKTLDIIELSAIVHDIACPLCRQKYGNAAGHLQELESPALLASFLGEFDLEKDVSDRIIWLVSHHHTTDKVDGIDHRILLEADFLVNAEKLSANRSSIEEFRRKVFRTENGCRLLDMIHLGNRTE